MICYQARPAQRQAGDREQSNGLKPNEKAFKRASAKTLVNEPRKDWPRELLVPLKEGSDYEEGERKDQHPLAEGVKPELLCNWRARQLPTLAKGIEEKQYPYRSDSNGGRLHRQ